MPIGAAIVGGVASIGGALLGNKSSSKSTKTAVAAQSEATAAELEAARLNQQLARDVYNSNSQVLSPYNQLGYGAAQARNALLGLGAGPAYQAPQMLSAPVNPASTGTTTSISGQNPLAAGMMGGVSQPVTGTASGGQAMVPTSGPASTPAIDYDAAFNQYLDSTGYKFQLNEGLSGLDHANRLTSLDSGAAMKSALNYNREMGKGYFNDYLGHLGVQQGMGLGAASAIAGQGSSYAGMMANANNQAGNALAGGAIGQGNLALAAGQNQANMWGNIAGGIGNAAGQLWAPSSYAQQQYNPYAQLNYHNSLFSY